MPEGSSPNVCLEPSPPDSNEQSRILLVDDEPDLCEAVREMLEQDGFVVLLAGNGEDALRIVEDDSGIIDLLLTDIQMPGMAGPELAREAKLLRPAMKVLFVSGDASEALASGRINADALILPKPFHHRTLAERVHWALSG